MMSSRITFSADGHGARSRRALTLALCLVSCALVPAYAQTPAASPAKGVGDVVALPAFQVASSTDDSFIGKEAMSTTRTGVAIADLAQSVVVVNKEFLNDLRPEYIADIMKYVGGGQTGTLTWTGSTRYMMRGYTTEGDFTDGFRMPSGNTNFNFVDHVEIIKGPSAIFVTNSANTVGGMVNKIAKAPTSYKVGTLTVEAAMFDRGGADLDIGGPITADKKFQYRLLLSDVDFKRYYDAGYDKRWSISPMFAYDFGPDSRVWVKMEKFDHDYSAYNGIAIDGRTNKLAAVSNKNNLNEDAPLNWRKDAFERIWGQFTTRPSDFLAVRIAALAYTAPSSRIESIASPVGATNPTLQANGNWIFTPYAQYTIPPNYVAGQLIPRITQADKVFRPGREVQNDYIFSFNTGPVSHKLLIGGVARQDIQTNHSYSSGGTSTATSSSIDPFNPKFPGTVTVNLNQPPVNFQEQDSVFFKGFILDTLSFMKDRAIFTFGVSRNRFSQSSTSQDYNQRTGVYATPVNVPATILNKSLTQYSILLKPLPNVSVFYGYNVNFAANPIQFGQFLPPQEGKQSEFGFKSNWLGGRLNIAANYFDIQQLNNNVQPFPQTVPPSFLLINGVLSKGVDGDISFAVNDNLLFIASFAVFDASAALRSPWSVTPMPSDGQKHATLPVNNVSEKNFSLWGRYKFTTGPVKGLSIGVGLNTLSKRAITDNANQILYGYVPGYGLVDANFNYETKRFKYQLRIDNLLNKKDYFHAVRSNQVMLPGFPTNVGGAIIYKF